jgi:hypothetical protein
MPNRPNYLRYLVLGTSTGVILLPLLTVLYAILFDPDQLIGHVITALLYGLPIGGWLGLAAGSALFYLHRRQRRGAGSNFLVGGGMVLLFFGLFLLELDAGEVFRIFAVPILSAIAFCLYGGWLLIIGKNET